MAYKLFQFRNNNPDKGTETAKVQGADLPRIICLEIITPIRGRKLADYFGVKIGDILFRNNNPDKGTETFA